MAMLDSPRIVSSRAQYADSYTLTRYLETGGYVALRKALTMFPKRSPPRSTRRRCSEEAARAFPPGASGRCCARPPCPISW